MTIVSQIRQLPKRSVSRMQYKELGACMDTKHHTRTATALLLLHWRVGKTAFAAQQYSCRCIVATSVCLLLYSCACGS